MIKNVDRILEKKTLKKKLLIRTVKLVDRLSEEREINTALKINARFNNDTQKFIFEKQMTEKYTKLDYI